MFFDDPKKVQGLAEKSGFSIFVLPKTLIPTIKFITKNIVEISPGKNDKISVDAIRDIIDLCKVEQKTPFFIVLREAEKLNEQAENAFLKLLEEPGENYHFVLFITDTSALLETVLSRGDIYILKDRDRLSKPLSSQSVEFQDYAKKLISAKPAELPKLADDITKNPRIKKDLRENILTIISLAIEISYKSYFKTGNLNFIKKMPKLITLEDNIRKNGHIKLHLVADLC